MKRLSMKKLKQLLAISFAITMSNSVNAQTPGFVTTGGTDAVSTPIYVNGTSTTGIYIGRGGNNATSGNASTAVGVGALVNTSNNENGNTAIGFNSLHLLNSANSSVNIAIGQNAMANITSSNGNIAVGNSALMSVTPSSIATANIALGHNALLRNTADNNIAIGTNTLSNNSSGRNNISIGVTSMTSNTTGSSNIVMGWQSSISNTTGSNNVAIGQSTLGANISSGGNTAIGFSALGSTTGANNTAIGNSALNSLGSGSNNIGIGSSANVPVSSNSNQLSIQNIIYGTDNSGYNNLISTGYIGIGVIPTSSAKLHVAGGVPSLQLDLVPTYTGTLPVTNPGGATGNYLFVDANGIVSQAATTSGITASCSTQNYVSKFDNTGNLTCSIIYDNGIGSVGINQTSGFGYTAGATLASGTPTPPTSFTLAVNGWTSSTAFVALSDQRIKKDIKKIESPLDKIAKIGGYTYNWNKAYRSDRKLNDDRQAGFLAQEIEKVLPEAVVKNSDGIYGLNYNAIMPLLSEGINDQQKEIESLKTEIADLKNKLNQLVPGNIKVRTDDFQIAPNPITKTAVIKFKLDNAAAKTSFVVYDLSGKMIQQISVPANTKEGQVQISNKGLAKGIYILSLVSDNTEIQSKRVMIAD